jgi:hypothetical protein
MGTVRATIVDDLTHQPVEARVHVLSSTGQFRAPPDAILKVGGGPPFFYADGQFTLDLPIGDAQFVLERGTEYLPLTHTLSIPRTGTVEVEFRLQRWIDLRADGWHAGNTHIHYNEHETRPDERLRLDPRIEDLSVAAISVLKRRELAYASNKYRIGFAQRLSSDTLSIDVGEETRHNDGPWGRGYGHVMLLGLQQLVEPVSRGALVDDFSPDYPPLIDACDEARSQGGVAIWCHNGNGMEAPVATSLGKLDAFNLFDPYWMDPEWDVWYALLSCGFALPASTGSDWFICSSNRVYVHTGASTEPPPPDHGAPDQHAGGAHPQNPGAIRPLSHSATSDHHDDHHDRIVRAFSYSAWLDNLRAGRTFITNGPAIWLDVAGHSPGDALDLTSPTRLPTTIRWRSAHPINRVELIHNGEVAARQLYPEGSIEGTLSHTAEATPSDGHSWLAARLFGDHRTSYGHFLWAHTSPVYLRARSSASPTPIGPHTRRAAARFVEDLDRSLSWIRTRGKYHSVAQRDRMLELFTSSKDRFTSLARP